MNDDTDGNNIELHVAFGHDSATVTVRGEVDLLTAPALAGVLNSVVDSGGGHLVVDLAECQFMDASGVGVLADVAVRMSATDGTLTIRSASAVVHRVLELAHLDNVIAYERSDITPSSVPMTASTALVRTGTEVVDAALRLVTALAEATVDNADGVSVTLERHGQLMTVAASNDKVLTMDKHQYETGEGPCLAAKAEGRWYYIESLDDETRWPAFVPLALGQGIHSILSSPLMTNDRPQGALNIYSSQQQAFGTHEQELAALFATQASEILTTSLPTLTDEQSNRQFAAALTERRTIHQAQGVIMARNDLTADDAIGSLFRAARAAGVTVLSYATDVVASIRDGGQD